MPVSFSILSGDGVSDNLIDIDVLLPDSGTTITVAGQIQIAPNNAGNINAGLGGLIPVGGTVTYPGAPGSGTVWFLAQVNTTSGAVSSKTSSSALPSPDAGNIAVWSQAIATGTGTNPSLAGGVTQVLSW